MWTGAAGIRYACKTTIPSGERDSDLAASKPSVADMALTQPEALVLMGVYRFGPQTAYRVRQMFAEAPIASFSNSTGTVYPVIRRLAGRGLLDAQPVPDSRRGAEMLSCTEAGRRALKTWVMEIGKEEMVLVDAARSKLAGFNLLTPQERVEWFDRLLARMEEATHTLAEFTHRHADVPFAEMLEDNFMSTLEARRAWAERTRKALAVRD